MYSQGDIEDAVASGALAPDQAASFRAFVAGRNRTSTTDEEYFRLLRGYNDIFVTYACVFALIALGWIGTLIPIGTGGRAMGPLPDLPVLAPLLVTLGSWGLAEVFARLRRTALAPFLLTFTFGLGVLLTFAMITVPMMTSSESASLFISLSALLGAAATWAYWLRFKVTVAPMVAVGLAVLAVIAIVALMFGTYGSGLDILNAVLLIVGIAVLAYALSWDFKDPWRVTESNEVGFWMHGLAAGLIVFPITYFLGINSGIGSAGASIAMIVLFLVLALIGLTVNRKAWLIVGVSPLVVALNGLIGGGARRGPSDYDPFGEGFGSAYGPGGYGGYNGYDDPMRASPYDTGGMFEGTVVTIVIVSIILLLLAFYWAPVRRAVMGIVPAGLRARLGGAEPTAEASADPLP